MCADLPSRRIAVQRGVTLIELIIFHRHHYRGHRRHSVVMNITTRSSADPIVRKQAVAMAEAILEEVLSKDGAASLPETDQNTCSNRALYVGVADYACFDGAPATAVISGTDTLGSTSLPVLAGLTATVAVTAVNVSGVAMQRVAVTVAGGNGLLRFFLTGRRGSEHEWTLFPESRLHAGRSDHGNRHNRNHRRHGRRVHSLAGRGLSRCRAASQTDR